MSNPPEVSCHINQLSSDVNQLSLNGSKASDSSSSGSGSSSSDSSSSDESDDQYGRFTENSPSIQDPEPPNNMEIIDLTECVTDDEEAVQIQIIPKRESNSLEHNSDFAASSQGNESESEPSLPHPRLKFKKGGEKKRGRDHSINRKTKGLTEARDGSHEKKKKKSTRTQALSEAFETNRKRRREEDHQRKEKPNAPPITPLKPARRTTRLHPVGSPAASNHSEASVSPRIAPTSPSVAIPAMNQSHVSPNPSTPQASTSSPRHANPPVQPLAYQYETIHKNIMVVTSAQMKQSIESHVPEIAVERCAPKMVLYGHVYVTATKKKGLGVYLDCFAPKGACLGEYVGEMIDEDMWERRYGINADPPIGTNGFAYDCGHGLWIDAGFKGNNLRFLNHSCVPNCQCVGIVIGKSLRVFLYAMENIHPVSDSVCCSFKYKFSHLLQNTELTLHYGDDPGKYPTGEDCFCECGDHCRGYIYKPLRTVRVRGGRQGGRQSGRR